MSRVGGSGESSGDGGGYGAAADETCLYLGKCGAIDAVGVVNVTHFHLGGCNLPRQRLIMAGDEEFRVATLCTESPRLL